METAQNPNVAMAVNMDELTAARLAMMHLPSGRILKTKEEIQQAVQAQQQQPDPAMIELQLKQQELAQGDRQLQLKEAQLRFEMGMQQQREAWEHEERMGANRAREAEAQASVIREQTVMKTEMIKLASKDQQYMQRLLADKEMHDLDIRAEVFMKSMEEQRKQRESQLVADELVLKAELGTGI